MCPPVGIRTNTSFPAKHALIASLCCGRKAGTPNFGSAAFTEASHGKLCAQFRPGALQALSEFMADSVGGACQAP